MLGGLRFVLALLVVVTHLSGAPAWGHLGGFAIFGFYLLSGYLMTMVLHEVYAFRFAAFAANRALRLFPVYFVVAGATLLVILPLQPEATGYHYAYGIRTQHWDLAGNLLLAPFELYDRKFRLVPPTWSSVGVEIINYALLWLFVARRRSWALGTFVCAVAYHLIALGVGIRRGRVSLPLPASFSGTWRIRSSSSTGWSDSSSSWRCPRGPCVAGMSS